MEHLRKWTRRLSGADARLDLWDTGQTRGGKNRLHYALWIGSDPVDTSGVIFEGDDYFPSPLTSIDSDECAGGLLSFFSAYGESIRLSGDDADVPHFTPKQRETLATQGEELGQWSYELEES